MRKKFVVIGCFLVLLFIFGNGMSVKSVLSVENNEQKVKKMYLNQLPFSEGTLLFNNSNEILFSLRNFFEGIGSEVIFDEKTGNIQINHLNQVLLCEKHIVSSTVSVISIKK